MTTNLTNLSKQGSISEILFNFNKEKKKTKFSDLTKERYAEEFAKYQNSDLEKLKGDIEYSIDKARNSIPFLTFWGIIGTNIIIISAVPGTLKFWLGFIFTVFSAVMGINVTLKIENDLLLLHILKKAIAQKSESLEKKDSYESQQLFTYLDRNNPKYLEHQNQIFEETKQVLLDYVKKTVAQETTSLAKFPSVSTLEQIKVMSSQLSIQEQTSLMKAFEERLESLTLMQLAETGFQDWNDPEEDIYNVES